MELILNAQPNVSSTTLRTPGEWIMTRHQQDLLRIRLQRNHEQEEDNESASVTTDASDFFGFASSNPSNPDDDVLSEVSTVWNEFDTIDEEAYFMPYAPQATLVIANDDNAVGTDDVINSQSVGAPFPLSFPDFLTTVDDTNQINHPNCLFCSMNLFNQNFEVRTLMGCGHVFHDICLEQNYYIYQKFFCPFCNILIYPNRDGSIGKKLIFNF